MLQITCTCTWHVASVCSYALVGFTSTIFKLGKHLILLINAYTMGAQLDQCSMILTILSCEERWTDKGFHVLLLAAHAVVSLVWALARNWITWETRTVDKTHTISLTVGEKISAHLWTNQFFLSQPEFVNSFWNDSFLILTTIQKAMVDALGRREEGWTHQLSSYWLSGLSSVWSPPRFWHQSWASHLCPPKNS